MPLPRLTAEDKIMLHLRDWLSAVDAYERPPEMTQYGISEATGIKRGYVAIVLGKMRDKGRVEVGLSRIRGKARSHKAYWLTPAGLGEATKLHEGLRDCTVTINGAEISFREAVDTGPSPVQVLRLSEIGPGQTAQASEAGPPSKREETADEETRDHPVKAPEDDPKTEDSGPEPGTGERIEVPRVGVKVESMKIGAKAGFPPAFMARRKRKEHLLLGLDTLGIGLLASTFLVIDQPIIFFGMYVFALVYLAVALFTSKDMGMVFIPVVSASAIMVHLSYFSRGIEGVSAVTLPLAALSLLIFYIIWPKGSWKHRIIAIVGTIMVFHGLVSLNPELERGAVYPEAWIIVGASAVLLADPGWGLGIQSLRGISLGASLFCIALVPTYVKTGSLDPLVYPVLGLIVISGVIFFPISLSNRPLRRIFKTAVVLAMGGILAVLSVTLFGYDMVIPGSIEALLAVTILGRGLYRSGLQRKSDLLIAMYFALVPSAIVGIWLPRIF